MTYQPFLIAPLDSGLNTRYDAWLSPNDAVTDGNNFIIRQGKIEKRRGYTEFWDFGNGDSVLAIFQYIDNTNEKELIVIQENNIWSYDYTTPTFNAIAGASLSATDYSYYNSALFPVNPNNHLFFINNASPLQYYNGTNVTVQTVTIDGVGSTVSTAGWVFYYGSRLVLLDTTETGGRFGQRARWSAVDDPTSWRDDIAGAGGYTDAASGDFIKGAGFLRDNLIVFFEKSTWLLLRSSSSTLPFYWQKINDGRESNAPYSVVEYDSFLVSIGETGVIASNGSEVNLFSEKIPFFTSDKINQAYIDRIFGHRYILEEETWWTYPSSSSTGDNDSLLFLSNLLNSWGKGDIPLTCLGGYETEIEVAWDDFGASLPDYKWIDLGSETWIDAFRGPDSRIMLGGTVDGKLYHLDFTASDEGDPINFVIETKEFNPFLQQGLRAYFGYVDILVNIDAHTSLNVDFYVNDEIAPVLTKSTNFLPNTAILEDISNVSLTNPCQVEVNNHGLDTGDSIYIYDIVGTTELNNNNFTVTVVDDNNITLDGVDATGYTAYVSGGVVSNDALTGGKVWKRVYAGITGDFHKLKIYHTAANQPVIIHGMALWMKPIKGSSL